MEKQIYQQKKLSKHIPSKNLPEIFPNLSKKQTLGKTKQKPSNILPKVPQKSSKRPPKSI